MIKESKPIRTQENDSAEKESQGAAFHTENEGASLSPPSYKPQGAKGAANYVQQMQQGLGTSFKDTKVIKNSPKAKAMGAKAFSEGNKIHFNSGEYQPDTKKGQEILGHELVHVNQQAKGKVQATDSQGGQKVNNDTGLEHQANAERDNIERGNSASSSLQNANPQQASGAPAQGFLGGLLKKVGGGIKSMAKGAVNGVKSVGSSVWNAGKGAAKFGANKIKSVANTVKKGASGLFGKVGGFLGGVKDKAVGAFESIKETGGGILDKVKGLGSKVFNGMKKIGSNTMEAVKDVVGGLAEKGSAALDWMKGVGGNIASKAKAVFKKIKSVGSRGLGYLKKVGSGVFGVLKSVGGGLIGGMKDIFSGNFGDGFKKMGMGLANGIAGGISTFLDATAGLFDSFLGPQGEEVQESELPARTAMDEFAAHQMAYKTPKDLEGGAGLSPKERGILEAGGYDPDNIMVKTGPNGFQATLIMSSEEGVLPMLAIRGTADLAGGITDTDPDQVGDFQYNNNKETIAAMIEAAGGKVDITGHSLGGAMAQIVSAHHTSAIGRLTTFQSPGISKETADTYKNNVSKLNEEDRPEVNHHTVNNDLVSKAGEENLPGTIYEHDLGNIDPIAAHTSYVTATSGFEEQRNQFGITNDFMENDIGKEINDETVITKFTEQPHKYKRLVAEFVRGGIGEIREFAKSAFGAGKKVFSSGKTLIKKLFNSAKSKGKSALKKFKGFIKSLAGG